MSNPDKLTVADQDFITDAWKKFQQAENERLHLCVEKLSAALLCIMDAVDQTATKWGDDRIAAVIERTVLNNAREAMRFPDRANRPTLPEGEMEKLFAEKRLERAAPKLLEALKEILMGSEECGVWRDERGHECDKDEPGARFEAYDDEEQAAWISSVAETARAAIANAGISP